MSNRIFKLEINGSKEKVSFGPRKPGDIGRDILLVKQALGQIMDYRSLIEEDDETAVAIDDPNGWFDCVTGKQISNVDAARFDKNLQTYVANFQLKNQFYILSYYFTKFAVPEATSKKNSILRNEQYSAPDEEYERGKDISGWVSSGINELILPAGSSIKLQTGLANLAGADSITEVELYNTHGLLSQQLDLIARLYNAEFGKIGEATLAVMHGWLPRTKLFNEAYLYEQESLEGEDKACDIIPSPIYKALIQEQKSGKLFHTLPDSTEISAQYDVRQIAERDKLIKIYQSQVTGAEKIEIVTSNNSLLPDWLIFRPEFFAAIAYDVSKRKKGYTSILYDAIEQASKRDDLGSRTAFDTDARVISNEDYSDALRRISEPDPMMDPDPFIISNQELGHFFRTEYTLNNLPPLESLLSKQEYLSQIRELEDQALLEVLAFYGKPHIFYLDTRDPKFQYAFIGKPEPYFEENSKAQTPSHDGSLLSQNLISTSESGDINKKVWVLTINEQKITEEQRQGLEFYKNFERNSNGNLHGIGIVEPLIKFAEFITPSLRPGDVYRAKFTINREKLDCIVNGYVSKGQVEAAKSETKKTRESSISNQVANSALAAGCEDEAAPEDIWKGTSIEDQKRRYEEYKALASKRKREIQRSIREKTLETWNNDKDAHSIDVDLGVFGNANLNFTGMVADSYDYTTDVLNFFGEALQSNYDSTATNPEYADHEELSISYPDLVERAQRASKYISEAYNEAVKARIVFDPPSFNGAQAAVFMANLPAELMDCIRKYKNPNNPPFDFGDGTSGTAVSNYFASAAAFSGLGLNDIKFNFKPSSNGLKITGITAGNGNISEEDVAKYPSLSDPITVGYLAQIEEMAPLGGEIPFMSGVTDACREIGIGKRGMGYLMRHTAALKGDPTEYDPINVWYEQNVEQPFNKWVKQSKNNLDNLFEPNFNEDELMKLLGKKCTLKTLYREYATKLSLPGLMCDFLRCLRLPNINIKIPNFQLPPFPRLDIFGWYRGMIETLLKKFVEILVRILCSFVRMILDFLKFPLCAEQLKDQLYGQMASTSPIIQQALVDGLTDLGISPDSFEKAKEFSDEALVFLTGDELCALFRGETIDPAAMTMLEKLAERKGIEDLRSQEAIVNFFGTIGIFMPETFCLDLESLPGSNLNWSLGSMGCDDETSYIDQIRKRMLTGGATDAEIDAAVKLANDNLRNQAETLQALGETGLEGLLPDFINFGDPNALINDLPESFKRQTGRSVKGLFDSAKMGYLSSLSNYGPSLFLDSPKIASPGSQDYDEEATLIVTTILENLRIYSELLKKQPDAPNPEDYIQQLNALHQIYETTTYKGATILQPYYTEAFSGFRKEVQFKTYTPSDGYMFAPISMGRLAGFNPRQQEQVYLKPVGFREYDFFLINNEVIENQAPEDPIEFARFSFENNACKTLDKGKDSNLKGFSFVNNYLIQKRAEIPIHEEQDDDEGLPPGFNSEAMPAALEEGASATVLTDAISKRLQFLQSALQYHMSNVAKQVPGTEYLGGIKQLFSLANETAIENMKANRDQPPPRSELIDEIGEGNAWSGLLLNLRNGSLRSRIEYREINLLADNPDTPPKFEPYEVRISDTNMFRTKTQDSPLVIKVCDRLPGPGTNSENDQFGTDLEEIEEMKDFVSEEFGQDSKLLYTKKELFARNIVARLSMLAGRHNRSLDPQKKNLIRSAMEKEIYGRSMEGIFEQIYFSLRNSNIYDENNYYPDLNKRVSGETHYDKVKGCYRNKYNISQFGILSFEKIVTDELAEQMAIELAKPENSPLNIDYDKAGPIEKAVQNVCLIGFIRICLVEMLLKGALAYSVWDFEGVHDEPLIEEFIFEYVKSELNRKEPMRQNWEQMIARITGISNHNLALRKLVKSQSMKMLDLSKKIYDKPEQNVDDEDSLDSYMDWYAKKVLPQSHCSRRISIRAGNDVVSKNQLVDLNGIVTEQKGPASTADTVKETLVWQHPLVDSGNIIYNGKSYDKIDNPQLKSLQGYFTDYSQGNNPFFHIEHLVRVQGPLASLESIEIPAMKLIHKALGFRHDNVFNTIVKIPEEDLIYTTTVTGDVPFSGLSIHAGAGRAQNNPFEGPTKYFGKKRDIEVLSIHRSLNRFVNTKKPHLDLKPYGFIATPELPAPSAGAATEAVLSDASEASGAKFSAGTELYHVEEFEKAMAFALKDGKSKKLINHIQGLMHNIDDPPEDPSEGDYKVRDVKGGTEAEPGPERDSVDMPETIMRTPSRFIKKTRRILKFNKDFISHDIDDFYDGDESPQEYQRLLFGAETAERFLTLSGDPEALPKANEFKQHVELSATEEEFYVVPSNGVQLLKMSRMLKENTQTADLKIKNDSSMFWTTDTEKYLDTIQEQELNGLIGETTISKPSEAVSDQEYDIAPDTDEDKYGVPKQMRIPNGTRAVTLRPAYSSGITDNEVFSFAAYDSALYSEDFLIYKPSADLDTEVVAFANPVGKFENQEDYDQIKEAYFTSEEQDILEEHWVETVYEFSGDASILGGIYGSFTIGETMDPAALAFEPSDDLIQKWKNILIPRIQRFSAPFENGASTYDVLQLQNENEAFAPIRRPGPDHGTYRRPYGATFWFTCEQDQELDMQSVTPEDLENITLKPYLARPMGINKYTNRRLTSKLLTRFHELDRDGDDNVDRLKDLAFIKAPFDFMHALPTAGIPAPVEGSDSWPENLKRWKSGVYPWFKNFMDADWGGLNLPDVEALGLKLQGASSYRDICKIIHDRPTISGDIRDATISYKNASLLPPNIYKIPIRVLVTQVFVEGEVKKAYCRVVPPEYIRDIHVNEDTSRTVGNLTFNSNIGQAARDKNIAKLNKAIEGIVDDYNAFCNDLESYVGVEDWGTPRYKIATEYFPERTMTLPEFTKEVSTIRTPIPRIETSYLQPDSPFQYCSIERIYSEVFKQETQDPNWNSTRELDFLFRENRGHLIKNKKPSVSAATMRHMHSSDPNATIKRLRYFESLNYFYNLPVDDAISRPGISGEHFHKTMFSLHNVLQWYLRARTDNSLWGQLTPRDTRYCNPVSYGPTEQHFPLAQSAMNWGDNPSSNVFPPAWAVAINTGRATGRAETNGHDRNRFFDDRFADTFYETPEFVIGDDRRDVGHTPTEDMAYYNRLGVMTLMHDFVSPNSNSYPDILSPEGPQGDPFTPIHFRNHTENLKLLSKDRNPPTKMDRYTFNQEKNLTTARLVTDGYGDYFVNYNRTSGFPILGNGSGLFVGDGRFSFNDMLKFFRSMIASILSEDSKASTITGGRRLDVIFKGFYDALFQRPSDEGSSWTPNTTKIFTFFDKIIKFDEHRSFTEDEAGLNEFRDSREFADFEIDLSAVDSYFLGFQSDEGSVANAREAQDKNPIEQAIPTDKLNNISELVEHLYDTVITTVESLIMRCGFMAKRQVVTEHVHYDSIFSENAKSLKRLEFMRRYLKKVKDSTFEEKSEVKKLGLLYVVTRYDFVDEVLAFYQPDGQVDQVREYYLRQWAKVCLYYFHFVTAYFSVSRNIRPAVDYMLMGANYMMDSQDPESTYPSDWDRRFRAMAIPILNLEHPNVDVNEENFPGRIWDADGPTRAARVRWEELLREFIQQNLHSIPDNYKDIWIRRSVQAYSHNTGAETPEGDLRLVANLAGFTGAADGNNRWQFGTMTESDPAFQAFNNLINLIFVQESPERKLTFAKPADGEDQKYDYQVSYNVEDAAAVTRDITRWRISGAQYDGNRHPEHHQEGDAAAMAAGQLIGADIGRGSGNEYDRTDQRRILAKLAPLRGHETAITAGKLGAFTLGNMAKFLKSGAWNNLETISGVAERPTYEQIIEWTHTVYDFLAERKPYDRGFLTGIIPHKIGDYGQIAEGLDNIYFSAAGSNAMVEQYCAHPFVLRWHDQDTGGRPLGTPRRAISDLYENLRSSLVIRESDPRNEAILKPAKFWRDYGESFVDPERSEAALNKMKAQLDSGFANNRKINHEYHVVQYGRVEDVLIDIDRQTYLDIDYTKFLYGQLESRGYDLENKVDDVSGTSKLIFETRLQNRTNRRAAYEKNLRKNSLVAPYAASKYTNNRLRALYEESPDDPRDPLNENISFKSGLSNRISDKVIQRIAAQWKAAFNEYSRAPDAITNVLFNDEALLSGEIVKGLLRNSKIDQVARLVFNVPDPDFLHNTDSKIGDDFFGFGNEFSRIAEEERSILMTTRDTALANYSPLDSDNYTAGGNTILSLPLSEVSNGMSLFGAPVPLVGPNPNIWVGCLSMENFREKFMEKTPMMTKNLLEQSNSKLFLKYIFPPKRYQALSTVFATTTLSTYSNMPSLMETPKSSLAFLMNITAMNSKERMQLVENMSQPELYKSLMDNKSSDPRGLECFDLPFSDEFLDTFVSMLLEAIKEFPSLLFRGLASVMDPAYKEMKLHWENCNIQELNYSGINPSSAKNRAKGPITGGAWGEKGEAKYAPLVTSTLTDTGYAMSKILTSPGEAAASLGWIAKNLTGYIYKGPISLIDGAFQFSIPCLTDEEVNWPDGGQYNFGRYGHPLSPLTLIALATNQLKGDKRLREMAGKCTDTPAETPYTRDHMEATDECNEADPPFGSMPKPEDFEE